MEPHSFKLDAHPRMEPAFSCTAGGKGSIGFEAGIGIILPLLLGLLLVTFPVACKKGGPTSSEPPRLPESIPADGLSFEGSISSGSQGLAGVPVFLSWDSSQAKETDANGRFEFSNVSGSHFIITPSLKDHAFFPSNYELETHSRDDLDFVVNPASYGSVIGDIAADFSAKDSSGQTVSLYDYFGKVVLLDFSSDFCGSCRREAEHLEELFQNHKEKGFQIILLLLSGQPSEWTRAYKLTFPVLEDWSLNVMGIYGEDYVPLNIILDRNMTIRYMEPGYDEPTIIDTIKKYL